jgi:hypothetical protein
VNNWHRPSPSLKLCIPPMQHTFTAHAIVQSVAEHSTKRLQILMVKARNKS